MRGTNTVVRLGDGVYLKHTKPSCRHNKAVCIESEDVYATQNCWVGATDFELMLYKFVA